jgi:hypothetical protein
MSIPLQDKYILPTPAGAYYCISSRETEPAKQFLQKLMAEKETMQLDAETLDHLLKDETNNQQQLLQHIHKLKWLQGFDQAIQILPGTIEQALPEILQLLSSDGKALLADDQGLYLASTGFTHEAAEELSALSGDLSSLYVRHQGIIKGNLNIKSSAFSIVDAAGYSQLGFWPVYIGDLMFVLVISGAPRFDQVAFVNLIWSLHKRYFNYKTSADSVAA